MGLGIDRTLIPPPPSGSILIGGRPVPSPPTGNAILGNRADTDEGFRRWYSTRASSLGLSPNPDDPQHRYDYRAAFAAGGEPDAEGHWPSQFKADDHPNRFVNGVDTKTGRPIPPPPSGKAIMPRAEGLRGEDFDAAMERERSRGFEVPDWAKATGVGIGTAILEGIPQLGALVVDSMKERVRAPQILGRAALAGDWSAIRNYKPAGTTQQGVTEAFTEVQKYGKGLAGVEADTSREDFLSRIAGGLINFPVARALGLVRVVGRGLGNRKALKLTEIGEELLTDAQKAEVIAGNPVQLSETQIREFRLTPLADRMGEAIRTDLADLEPTGEAMSRLQTNEAGALVGQALRSMPEDEAARRALRRSVQPIGLTPEQQTVATAIVRGPGMQRRGLGASAGMRNSERARLAGSPVLPGEEIAPLAIRGREIPPPPTGAIVDTSRRLDPSTIAAAGRRADELAPPVQRIETSTDLHRGELVELETPTPAYRIPVKRQEIRQYLAQSPETTRAERGELFLTGLSEEQRLGLRSFDAGSGGKPRRAAAPPPERVQDYVPATPDELPSGFKEVGPSRYWTTMPDKLRSGDLGDSGYDAWRSLQERNFLHERMQSADERRLALITKGWSKQDQLDAYKYGDGTISPKNLASIRPEVKAAVDAEKRLLRTRADELVNRGVTVPDEKGTRRPFRPLESGYMPRVRIEEGEETLLNIDLPYRRAGTPRGHLKARTGEIEHVEHFSNSLIPYYDQTNEVLATFDTFGDVPERAIRKFAIRAAEEGKDGNYVEEALRLSLNGGLTVPKYERKLLQNLSDFVVANTLTFSGPAQLSQLGPIVVKAGVVDSLKGFKILLRAIKEPELREALVRSGVGFESLSRTLHGQHRKGFLGRWAELTLKSPVGVSWADKLMRYTGAAISRPYAEDLAKVVTGQPVPWYKRTGLASIQKAERELSEAGIDVPSLKSRGGKLTDEDYDRFAWRFSLDGNLGQRSEDTSVIFARSPYGRVRGLLLRFAMQQPQQLKREVLAPLRQKNVMPFIRWAAITPVIGAAQMKMADAIYGRDAGQKTAGEKLMEAYLAGSLGIFYHAALAAKYGFDGFVGGVANDKVSQVLDTLSAYPKRAYSALVGAAVEGSARPITDELQRSGEEVLQGQGPLWRTARINPAVNAAYRHIQRRK